MANDAGSRIGQSSGYAAQIGVDMQLAVHYGWGVNGRLKQLDATFPDSYGSGTPAVSHWRAGYAFGNAEDGNLLTWLLRQRVDGAGAEDWVDSLYAYEAGRDNSLSVTNRMLVALAAGCAPISSADSFNEAETFCQNSHTPFPPFSSYRGHFKPGTLLGLQEISRFP